MKRGASSLPALARSSRRIYPHQMDCVAIEQKTTVLVTADVARERAFFVEAFGYQVLLDIGWFVSLRHAQAGTLDLWSVAHESAKPLASGPSAGFVLAYVVADAEAADKITRAAGATLLQPLRDEPWGQRHVLLRTPGGAVLDLVQRIAPDTAWLAQHGLG